MRQSFTFLLLLTYSLLSAQTPSDRAFAQMCTDMQVEILLPTERTYRSIKPQKNGIQPYHFALYSRKEKMEMRYYLQAYQPGDPLGDLPHVHLSRLLMNLASNEADTHIAVHDIPKSSLASDYQADWGQVCFFPPKQAFGGDYEQCQMLALYREGVGMAYVFFLFNEAPETLPARKLALYFSEPLPEQ